MCHSSLATGAAILLVRSCSLPAPCAPMWPRRLRQFDAEERGRFGHALAAVDGVVDSGDRPRRIEVVVEGRPHLRHGRATTPRLACRTLPPVEAVGGPGHEAVVPLPFVAVVVLEDGEADGARIPLGPELIDEYEIAEALRHLLAVHPHHPDVHPVAHEGLSRG